MKYTFTLASFLASTSAVKLEDPSTVWGTWYGDKAKILNFND